MILIETQINVLIAFILYFGNVFFKSRLPSFENESIQILGTGPSLNNDLDEIMALSKQGNKIMAVNLFAQSQLYEKLKPEFYILADPEFFVDKADERVLNIQKNTLNSLVNKTHWKLRLFIPYASRKSKFCINIKDDNPNIEITFFKNISIIGGFQKINNFLFKFNLANPLYQNVLIAAIFICIKMKFSEILLWGADHSWHEDFILGKDNKIYTPDKHFYKNNKSGDFIHTNPDGTPVKVYEEFSNLARSFRAYHSLESYSKVCNCKIINRSSKTWIDAFKREW